ncbi:unnamed protein product [Darwinula stevensoni]|uniref:Uncharacterized protein n=1 Tax=Darwinula stevensoni TaxID=69355 RepID=A0A7R8WXX6_9CRUS|nr:unnamed protein product [Darwinula stevensoni]CAG0878490.1 unnamed protein product [Darwinula stevensoni]
MKSDWRGILRCMEERGKKDENLAWTLPDLKSLEFIADEVRTQGIDRVTSVGSGSGLFEWLLHKATDVTRFRETSGDSSPEAGGKMFYYPFGAMAPFRLTAKIPDPTGNTISASRCLLQGRVIKLRRTTGAWLVFQAFISFLEATVPIIGSALGHSVRAKRGIDVSDGIGCLLLDSEVIKKKQANLLLSLQVDGIEVDRGWWESEHSLTPFIPLLFADEDSWTVDHTSAFFTCYFNNFAVFYDYLQHYSGPSLIIVGPDLPGTTFSSPGPYDLCSHPDWTMARVHTMTLSQEE